VARSRTEFINALPQPGDGSPLAELLRAGRVVTLKGSDKRMALEQMVSAAARVLGLNAGEQLDLSAAVLAREAMLNTQLGPGWAAPHATLEIGNEVVLVVGRSRSGFDYGRPELGRVHLVFLFISSPAGHDRYLKALSALVALFKDAPEQRVQQAIAAQGAQAFIAALAGPAARRARVSRRLPPVIRALLRNMQRFADEVDAGTLLMFADVLNHPELLETFVDQRVVLATRGVDLPDSIVRRARGVVRLSRGDMAEESAVQLALLAAAARDLLGPQHRAIAICGAPRSDNFDTMRIEQPRALSSRIFSKASRENVQPEVFERAIQLLLELAEEGREGRAVGTTVVIGDEEAVRGMCQQLTINPFRGYEERERNLLDPALEETFKEFSGLDGAFVVSRAGVIQSAGTYLSPPAEVRVELVSGLGTRHRVAAALTKATRAIALVLSQSSGKITVFSGGKAVLTVAPTRARAEFRGEGF
jgi:DNA integrity scanning protein DisA with diadenylate cyclase activity/mannitol/fructose-specific phosphotransferase system IIA component (Ntr-type)